MNSIIGQGRHHPHPDGYDRIAFEDARATNARATAIGMTPIPFEPTHVPGLVAVELKYNGICCCWNDAVGPATLEGVPMPCASHLNEGFAAMQKAAGVRMFFQAEYLVPGGLEETSSAFQRGEPAGFAVVFEAVPLAVWQGQEHSLPLIQRRNILEALHSAASPRNIGLSMHSQGYTLEGIGRAAHAAWASDEEGIITKDLLSPFVRGRSRAWMKLKAQLTVDVPIQSIRSIGGRLRSIVVTYKGRPVVVPVGFSEDQRRQLDEFRTGRTVEIKHNGETRGGMLMGATFLRFRDDKAGGGDGG